MNKDNSPKENFIFLVVWEEVLRKYQCMETAWTKESIESINCYDFDGNKSQKWKVVSQYNTKEDARIACGKLNKLLEAVCAPL